MSFLFENLRIGRLIVHETGLAHDLDSSHPPKLSEELAILSAEAKAFIEQRIVDALGSESQSLEMEVEQPEDGAFGLCGTLPESSDDTFITTSKRLAAKLTAAQTAGTVKAGIAVVFDGTVGAENFPFVGVMKAETASGFEKQTMEQGVQLHYIQDLVLGSQKLYKIGCFVQRAPTFGTPDPMDFLVFVYDHLMSQTASRNAAVYFYKTFLGCRIASTDKILTKDFYERSSEFINGLDAQDEDKVDFKNNLTAYLNSQKPQISVHEFAHDFFEPALRNDYVGFMVGSALPQRAFMKDLGLIKGKLRQRRIRFSSKIRIIGPSDDFADLVKVQESGSEWTIVRVAGVIEEQT